MANVTPEALTEIANARHGATLYFPGKLQLELPTERKAGTLTAISLVMSVVLGMENEDFQSICDWLADNSFTPTKRK